MTSEADLMDLNTYFAIAGTICYVIICIGAIARYLTNAVPQQWMEHTSQIGLIILAAGAFALIFDHPTAVIPISVRWKALLFKSGLALYALQWVWHSAKLWYLATFKHQHQHWIERRG